MVKSRFECEIGFIDYRKAQNDLKGLIDRNRNSEMIVSGNDLVLPIIDKSELFGAVQVLNGGHLRPSQMTEIRQLVDLTIGSLLLLESRDVLSRTIENFLTFSSVAEDSTIAKLDFMVPDLEFEEPVTFDAEPVFLEGRSVEEQRKTALEIHHQSENSAFLNFRDLPEDTRLNIFAVMELGPITIFVDNLEVLSDLEKNVLEGLLRQANKGSYIPKLIFSYEFSLGVAREKDLISEEMFLELKGRELSVKLNKEAKIEQTAKLLMFRPSAKDLN